METMKLKDEFHSLIDKFSDVKILEQFYEVLSDYQIRKKGFDILEELTKDQQKRLQTSVKQAQKGKTISHDEVKGKVKDWLTE